MSFHWLSPVSTAALDQWTKVTICTPEQSPDEFSQLPEFATSPVLNVLQALVTGLNFLAKARKEDMVQIEDKREKDKEVYEVWICELAEQMQEMHVQMIEVS